MFSNSVKVEYIPNATLVSMVDIIATTIRAIHTIFNIVLALLNSVDGPNQKCSFFDSLTITLDSFFKSKNYLRYG